MKSLDSTEKTSFEHFYKKYDSAEKYIVSVSLEGGNSNITLVIDTDMFEKNKDAILELLKRTLETLVNDIKGGNFNETKQAENVPGNK